MKIDELTGLAGGEVEDGEEDAEIDEGAGGPGGVGEGEEPAFALDPGLVGEEGSGEEGGEGETEGGEGGPGPILREAAEHAPSLIEGGGAEEEPGEADEVKGGGGLDESEPSGLGVAGLSRSDAGEEAVADEPGAVHGAPGDESPAGAMPEAADEHGDHEIAGGGAEAAATAAEGDVKVVAEPAGEADVPAAPEVLGGGGEVGVPEVVHQIEAEPASESLGDGAVAAEVAVDLKGEGINAGEDLPGGEFVGGAGEGGIGDEGEVVGDDNFAEEAGEDVVEALTKALLVEFFAGSGDLSEEPGGTLDGAGEQLGEEGNVGGVVEERLGGLDAAAEEIDGVGEGLEGIEGDADGEDDLGQPPGALVAEPVGEGADLGDREAEVFEGAEEADVEDEREREPAFARRVAGGLMDAATDDVIDDGGEADEQEEAPIPPAVEDIAGDEEQAVLPAVREPRVQGGDDGEKGPEGEGVEKHAGRARGEGGGGGSAPAGIREIGGEDIRGELVELLIEGGHGGAILGAGKGGVRAPLGQADAGGPGQGAGGGVAGEEVIDPAPGRGGRDLAAGPVLRGAMAGLPDQDQQVLSEPAGAEAESGLGVEVGHGADMSVLADAEGATGEEGLDGGDAAALAPGHDDRGAGAALEAADLVNGEGLVDFEGLRGAEVTGEAEDVRLGAAGFGLADEHDFEVRGQGGQGLEEFPMTFEGAPVGDHDQVDVTVLRGERLVVVREDPIAGESGEAAKAGMEGLDAGDFAVVATLDEDGAPGAAEGEGEGGVVSGRPAGGEDEIVAAVEEAPGGVIEAGEEADPVVFEGEEEEAFFGRGLGGFEEDGAVDPGAFGKALAVAGRAKNGLFPEVEAVFEAGLAVKRAGAGVAEGRGIGGGKGAGEVEGAGDGVVGEGGAGETEPAGEEAEPGGVAGGVLRSDEETPEASWKEALDGGEAGEGWHGGGICLCGVWAGRVGMGR